MLSKKKYNNTSISPGTAGKYVRRDSLTSSEDVVSTASSSQDSNKAPFDISQLPILNPGTIQPQYGFRRDGRDRHPVKRANIQTVMSKGVPSSNSQNSANASTSLACQQSSDPFLKVSHYTAPVAMLSTQIPSHITVGVAQPIQVVHSGQKGQSQPLNNAPSALGANSGDIGGPMLCAYPMKFGANDVSSEVCNLTGEPIVPPNPMVHTEIPEWIRVYVKAHPRHDDKLKWGMFSLPQLTNFDLMVKWQMKREIEEIVLAYERYRTAIIQEMHRRKIDANRYIIPS